MDDELINKWLSMRNIPVGFLAVCICALRVCSLGLFALVALR